MSQTYCGKNCSECTQKEVLSCSGCKSGPGRQFGGDCELAKCCREKGHEVCDTCGLYRSCGVWWKRDGQPEYRKRKIEEEVRQKKAAAKKTLILGKWIWILFWLIVPTIVTWIMGTEMIMGDYPGFYLIGLILFQVCFIAYGLILLKISSEEDGYRTAGICIIVYGFIKGLLLFIFKIEVLPKWTLVITIPAGIIALIGEYYEYRAHSDVLVGIDNNLSEKWTILKKWYVGGILAFCCSFILMMIAPLLGLIALWGGAIVYLVVKIIKLVYLYRTAKMFRKYSADDIASEKSKKEVELHNK